MQNINLTDVPEAPTVEALADVVQANNRELRWILEALQREIGRR